MPETIAKIAIMDLPEFKALMAEVNSKVEALIQERNEARQECEAWEERYEKLVEKLLDAVGGVWPG